MLVAMPSRTPLGHAIAPWLVPILWREQDWIAALKRLSATATRANRLSGARAYRTAIELALALEYVDPDRRRAIAVYELAGDHERARELASELGWWSARARLSARIIDSPEHVLDEAAAWWDAGHPDLCALALAEVRGSDRGARGVELEALLAGVDLLRHATDAAKRAHASTGPQAAKEFMMAARFCRAAGRQDQLVRWLEAAVQAEPRHPVAAPFLLELACISRDPAPLKRFLKLRLECAPDLETWIDITRACALTLIRSEHYRGFGQRLLRQILQRAYAEQHPIIPGHLAMWNALAAHATTATMRRELLPLVVAALKVSHLPVDRVYLATYATEIALRDSNNPVVAGAYAEIVAEHAPDHPIVRELVAAVAVAIDDEPTNPIAMPVPIQAIEAARQDLRADATTRPIDLDSAYAEASMVDDAAVISSSPPPRDDAAPIARETERTAPRPFGKPLIASPPAATVITPAPAPSLPALPKIPTLAALRTPDRPVIPPPRADPPNAKFRAHRIAVPIDIRLDLADGTFADGMSRDISATGLFVLTTAPLAIDSELAIVLLLPGEEAFTEHEYPCQARVVRQADDGFGLELLAPSVELVAALDALG
jgi:hypothetical protein